jgi:hypothetical protein
MEDQTIKEVTTAGEVTATVADANGSSDVLPVAVPISEVKEIEIEIDLDELLIDDMEILDRAKDDNLPAGELLAFLDRIVVGGVKNRKMPMRYLALIMKELGEAISESVNPGN